MSKTSINFFLIFLLVCFSLVLFNINQVQASEHYQVVIHPEVQEKKLSVNVLRAIFSMRLRTWSNGTIIRVYVLSDNNELHHDFSKEKLNVFPYQLRLTWDRLVFSGTGQAPTHVDSPSEMQARIANTPGAIGYLNTAYINEEIQVIYVK